MTVIRADKTGFCMGVRRAVALAKDAASRRATPGELPRKRIFTLGPLIHNDTVLASLREKGIGIIDEGGISSLDAGCTVIIRAHGATRGALSALRATGAKIIDATCPRVALSQSVAQDCAERGRFVIIAGDMRHAEVESVASYAEGFVRVIGSGAEASRFTPPDGSLLLSQTTFSPAEFDAIARALKGKSPSLEVFNSICGALRARQEDLKALAGKVDGVVVIGGRASANTRSLYELARALFGAACLAENASGIPEAFFRLDRVALCSGASAPDEAVDEAERVLLEGGL